MTKLSEQIESLRLSIINIKEEMSKIKIENNLLQKQQASLVSEKAELVKKNEAARQQIELVIERIRNIDNP